MQRVSRAWVDVEGERRGSIGRGLVVLVGVGVDDQLDDASYLAEKIVNLRVFPDEEGKFNHSVRDIQGELLVVSQFTLFGDCRKGRRPSFTQAAPPEVAFPLYEEFLKLLAKSGLRIVTGKFQSMMEVGIVNDGPVTILLDSRKKF
ncbi:MAG: D-tyrosyl-tRNA(Tyr) deacylase [Thermoanaerobacterales bacterium 50_218]|nr:MAG: D-tyrosyl-tRNA(Tyr) deacylase [Thermoanaerobacterales bacterium 50_218]